MAEIFVHPRIFERHPEIVEQDVLDAWNSCIRIVPRLDRRPNEYIAIGCDSQGRLLEMIGIATSVDTWTVYHAFTPPTRKALKELELARR